MNRILRSRVRSALAFALVTASIGTPVGAALGVIDGEPALAAALRGLSIGFLAGAAIGLIERLVVPRWSRLMAFGAFTMTRFLAYTAIILGALTLVNAMSQSLEDRTTLASATVQYLTEKHWMRDLATSLGAAVVCLAGLQIASLHDPREIKRLLTGKYHYPEEESRVLLFVDLVGSTALADRLGDLRYSGLLRDVFGDISEAILAWRGEVNQYLGDSVIVTWPLGAGLTDAACVQCFFEMAERLEARAGKYRERYQAAPSLRAGLHAGSVVVSFVGETTRALAYHGINMNAAARIESLCGELGAHLLSADFTPRKTRAPTIVYMR